MKKQLFRLLADLRFSIFILLLISFSSILGTIIEQDQDIETYKKNYPLIKPIFGFFSWDRILYFGLDHVYRSWWFLTLIFLFGLSLILCSFFQQLPSLKIARRCQFFRKSEQFHRLKISSILSFISLNQILSRLKESNYSIFQQKNVVYCYKGLIGRIAPIIVHFSMILVLLGTVLGALFGFKAQEIVPNTESFHIQNLLSIGPFTHVPQVTGRVNNFWITYTKQKTISQFYSDLSILDKTGSEITRKTIRVNDPLIYNNIYYYQTDWNLLGVRVQDSTSEIAEYPLTNVFNTPKKIWLTWVSDNFSLKKGILLITDNLEGYCSFYNEKGEFLGNMEVNERIGLKPAQALLEVISSTGLQIKIDLGILVVYIGFFFLMSSILISYVSYSQVWLVQKNRKNFIGGTTSRAIFEFELEFFKFVRDN